MRKQGKVVSIRVRSLDCLSAIDVCTTAGIDVSMLSFPAVVAQALNIMLEAQRTMENIPIRDGFEWNDMMGGFDEGGAKINVKPFTKQGKGDKKEFERLKIWRADGPLPPELEDKYQELMRLHQPS